MWQYQNTDELYHHGVPGQRWGFRRYQNPDGTLTPAGRRRANKLAEKYAKVTGKKLIVKKKSVQGNEKQKPKTISEMSDYEIQQKINRINLENTYSKLLASQTPKPKVSRAKKFIDKVKKDVIAPAMITAGKKVLTGVLINESNKLLRSLGKDKTTQQIKNNLVKTTKQTQNKNKTTKGKKVTNKIIKRQIGFNTDWK
jgi:hypothetical protein